MKRETINHKRLEAVVRQQLTSAVFRLSEYEEEQREKPDSELAKVLHQFVLPGLCFERTKTTKKIFATINSEFLELVGYDNNLRGFLTDYFGENYKPAEGEPLRFQFLGGFLLNPTNYHK